jgi:uncharacterized membrane protein (UPF0127 family)
LPESPKVPELRILQAKMVFHSRDSAGAEVSGPVAVSAAERAHGLMFRRERLQDGEAMLFVMEGDEDHGFWMKNTFIPLDIVFVNGEGEVVGIAERVQPHTTESRSVGKPSRYIIEVDAGWCERHKVEAGSTVSISIDEPSA